MRIRFTWIALVIITIVAFMLRFYKLGDVPNSINADEAAIGYNAYSILKTGADEYGVKFPLLFQSFDDYKLPLYIYLTVPSISIFGFTDFAVRFPSALFGVLTVILTYFLVKELFVQKTINNKQNFMNLQLGTFYLPAISALLLAISPWHLQFSRSAYEANLAVFFTVLGMTCLLVGLKRRWLLVAGFISLALSVWSYHSSRIFVPLIIVCFSVLYFRTLLKNKWYFVSGAVICFLLCLPLLFMSFSSTGLVRAKGVSALSDPEAVKRNVTWRQTDIDAHIPFSNVFHNHRLVNIPIIVKGYLDHYNPNFFFSEIVQAKYHAPGVGLMYLWELPFLLIGIFMLVKTKSQELSTKLLICWFLLAPVAASVTHMLPHPVRTLVFLPTLQIFTAFGILSVLNWSRSLKVKGIIYSSLSVIVLISTLYYLHQYYIHGTVEYAMDWQYGRKQVVEKVKAMENNFDTVVISTSLDEPYMFFLYYLRFDPALYQSLGGTRSGKFDEERNAFGKYEFHTYMKADAVVDPRTLYVGTPGEMISGSWPLSEVTDPSGNIVFVLYGAMSKLQWNQWGLEPHLD